MNSLARWAFILGATGIGMGSPAAPPSIETFAGRPRIEGAAVSPDGRYLAVIQTLKGRGAAVVFDRRTRELSQSRVVMGEPDPFHIAWCRWATGTRLLCGYRAMTEIRSLYYGITRLAAVDADGGHMTVLLQNDDEVQGQFQDRIINWAPGTPDTVLVEADEGLSPFQVGTGAKIYGNVGTHALPAVWELNVVTGHLTLRQHARDPIRHWITDHHGQVRLGSGFVGTTISYYARLDRDREWRRLTKFEVFSRGNHLQPVAISADDPNKAFAIGPSEGRDAVWVIDLTDKEDPTLVFAHPVVDVSDPVFAHDGTLIGVHYETEYPSMYFVNERIRSLIEALKPVLPGKFNAVAGSSTDEQVFLIRSVTDRDAPTFGVLDVALKSFTRVGAPYPDIDAATLAPQQPITYPARDGTQIPGYLTMPNGETTKHLPLIVMPHGGPIARDTWRYFFLREFLASRGYAVLQMNFRGSSGYGADWLYAAHQDWGGLTYDDVVDAGRWAIQHGIADPERICIVGWSFGGYLALLGAQRNPDLFRCAVSISGISDLSLLIDEGYHWLNHAVVEKQIGVDPAKLKRDSPRMHGAEFGVPVLLIHGDHDAQAPYEQSKVMDAALTRAGKPHRLVTIHDADHQLSNVSDRVTLLHEVEEFLAKHLGGS